MLSRCFLMNFRRDQINYPVNHKKEIPGGKQYEIHIF